MMRRQQNRITSEEGTKEWLERVKDDVTTVKWLHRSAILLSFVVLYTLANDSFQLRGVETELNQATKIRDTVLQRGVAIYYEQAFLGADKYLQDTLQPWLEGCMAANLESMRMKANGIDTPQIKETIDLGARCVRTLGNYNSALRTVAFSHSRQIPFANLDRQTLLALLDALGFDFQSEQKLKELEAALTRSQGAMVVLATVYEKKPELQKESPKIFLAVKRGSELPQFFVTLRWNWLFVDLYMADKLNFTDADIQEIRRSVEKMPTSTLAELQSRIVVLTQHRDALRAGTEIRLPILDISMPLSRVAVFGLIFNIFVVSAMAMYLFRVASIISSLQNPELVKADQRLAILASVPYTTVTFPYSLRGLANWIVLLIPSISSMAVYFVRIKPSWSSALLQIVLFLALLILTGIFYGVYRRFLSGTISQAAE